jgi:hypothetical protein
MTAEQPLKFAIMTLAIGGDFCRDLAECLDAKCSYAQRHGYTYIQGGVEYWDRSRPIAWSKIPFLLEFLRGPQAASFDYIWFSDADVYITAPDKPLDRVAAAMPADKHLMLNVDSWGNVNSGNMLMRLRSSSNRDFLIDYFTRVWERTTDLYHIWYENKAMIDEYEAVPATKSLIAFNTDVTLFNTYVNGREGARLWQPGDFLVHFAGIYDTKKMRECIAKIKSGLLPY